MIQHFDFQKLSGADQIARHLDVRLAWRRVRAWTTSSRWVLSIPTSQRCQKRFVVMPTWVDCSIITTRTGRRHDANEYLHSTRQAVAERCGHRFTLAVASSGGVNLNLSQQKFLREPTSSA